MKIIVGSKNLVKVNAVKNTIKDYPLLANAIVEGIEVNSKVSSQPNTLEAIVNGAMNRAKAAFDNGADLGFGLESGIFKVPHTKTDYMNLEFCAIYDGKEYHLGTTSAFEYPKAIMKRVLEDGLEVSDAAKKCGFESQNKGARLGNNEGMIGILTKGRLNRTSYAMESVRMALIHLENSEHY